jgi:WD40 repeat protein
MHIAFKKGQLKHTTYIADTLEITPGAVHENMNHYGNILSWCLYNNSLAGRTYDSDQTLVTWDLETGKESFRWQQPEGKKDYIGSYVFNNDGIGAVAADKDHITLIDLRNGKKAGQFPIPHYGVMSGEWSGEYVPVYTSRTKKAFVFDIRNQQQALVSLEHASEPHSTLISRNGSMVASLGEVNELITAYIKNGEQPVTQETDNTANNYMLAWAANDTKCAVGNNETVNLYTPEITLH